MILWYIDESGVTKEERDLVVGGYSVDDNNYEKVIQEFKEIQNKHFGSSTRKISNQSIFTQEIDSVGKLGFLSE